MGVVGVVVCCAAVLCLVCRALLCPAALFCCVGSLPILQVRFLPSVPPPLLTPSSALPYRISSGWLATANSISAAVVTLLAFSLFGRWLAGPLGNQPKAPSPHPSKLQARMPRARAPRFAFVGHP